MITKDWNKLVVEQTFYYPEWWTYIQTNSYEKKFLENQKLAIEKQRDDFMALREKELLEVNNLLAECDKLWVEEIIEEPIVEEPIIEEPTMSRRTYSRRTNNWRNNN